MRRPLVVGNWKMNTGLSDAIVLATAIRDGLESISNLEVVLCPPTVWLTELSATIGNKIPHLSLGGQNINYLSEGAYTGEISAPMIANLAKYVIVGHSERRKNFAETSDLVSRKAAAALDAGISPIICVGESEKTKGSEKAVVDELKKSLVDVQKNELEKIVVAYEPVWAVGASSPATPEYCVRIISKLREVVSAETPILYGGDVTAGNIYEFIRRPEIDGVLVGRASLKASEFLKICRIAAEYKKIL